MNGVFKSVATVLAWLVVLATSCIVLGGFLLKKTIYDYRFKDADTAYEWGSARVRMVVPYNHVRSPYELLIAFSLNPGKEITRSCRVVINHLQLLSIENEKPVFSASNIEKAFEPAPHPDRRDHDAAYYKFSDLNLEFVDYDLDMDFTFTDSCSKDNQSIEKLLYHQKVRVKSDYKEETLSFWGLIARQ